MKAKTIKITLVFFMMGWFFSALWRHEITEIVAIFIAYYAGYYVNEK